MGLDTDSGETSCEDFDSRKLWKILTEDSDILKESEVHVLEGFDGGVPVEDSNHSGTPKTHACTYEGCAKVFSRPWRLARHMCIHTGEVCCWSLDLAVSLTFLLIDKLLLLIKYASNHFWNFL
jgi:hypothetical protein